MVDEIKNRIKITDIIYEAGLQMNPSGFMHSIYKQERTPSLKVYLDTNTYNCFATGKGGDVIQFYADLHKISNGEAIKEMSKKIGIKYTHSPFSASSSSSSSSRVSESVLKIQNMIYEDLYMGNSPMEDIAAEYLMGPERKLSEDTIKKFKFFYIKNPKETAKKLNELYTKEEIKCSGLFNDNGGFVFENHRIVMPYLENGKIVYLRGRYFRNGSAKEGKYPKYISLRNIAGNLTTKRFFNKDILAKLSKKAKLLICEGEFDTAIADQNGDNAIGICGTGNIPNDVKKLREFDVHLVFDNDDAGRIGMDKAAKLFNWPIKGVLIKNHKDLTEML